MDRESKLNNNNILPKTTKVIKWSPIMLSLPRYSQVHKYCYNIR